MEEMNTAPAAEETTEDATEKTVPHAQHLEVKRRLAEAEEALGTLEAERKALEDKYLRTAAEYENFRRRAAAEKAAAYTDGLSGALEKLLPILDNLERAALYQDGKRVAEGLAMIAKAAEGALDALGVETFGKPGETFDPELHNAVMHLEDEERGEGEITDVHQKGYKKGDRILRYAMVTVAN